MPSGFEAILNSGRVLIDENYANLRMVRRGFSVKASGYTGVNLWRNSLNLIDISCPSGRPVVIVRPLGRYVASMLDIEGSARGLFFGATTYWGHGTGQGSYGFEYAVFDSSGGSPPDNSNCGLQVFRSDGSPAYDSRFKYLQPRQVITIGAVPQAPSVLVANQNYLENAWYVMGTIPGGRHTNHGDGIWEFSVPMITQISPTQVGTTLVSVQASGAYGLRSVNTIIPCSITN